MKFCKFIAFGAGQCSSVLPFILDNYDLIIFADTGWELPLTYEWCKIVQKTFPMKFIWLKTKMPDNINHHPPICTKKYKVEPIRRYLRSIGVEKAVKHLGMTIEEKDRMSENSVKWVKHEYPLIERGWSRKNCQKYLLDNIGFVPPRSGCKICKYLSQKQRKLFEGIKIENKLIDHYLEVDP